MLELLLGIIIVGVIVLLLMYLVDYVSLPDPFAKVAKVLIIVFAVIWLISRLLPFVGGGKLF